MPSPIQVLKRMGVRGVAKSLYLSRKHDNKIGDIVISKQVMTDVSPTAVLTIENRLLFGVTTSGASHPNLGRSKFSLDAQSEFRSTTVDGTTNIGPNSIIHIEGTFEMGDSYINSHGRILCEDEITIGDGCAIAWNVEMLDSDRHQIYISGEKQEKTAPITILDNVWVGHSTSIKKGVTIGEGSVVASNSVVTSDVPPHTLVGGTPAKVLREDVHWEQ